MDSLTIDSVLINKEITAKSNIFSDHYVLWIFGFIIFIVIILFRFRWTLLALISKKRSKQEENNFDNLFENLSKIEESKGLYKTLLIRVHPDNFTDADLKNLAEHYAKLISENKTNYKQLKLLEAEIFEKLKN